MQPITSNCTSRIHRDISFSSQKAATIRLFDVSGKLILNKEVQLKDGQNSLLFNAEMIPSSIYILQVFDGKNNSSIKLFAK